MTSQNHDPCPEPASRAHVHDPCPKPVCCQDPATIYLQRNRYFRGKLMTERDFAADTEYLLSRHRLSNRLGLGWGIACGLDVRLVRQGGDCHGARVEICPGVAIDCYGREIVLCEMECVNLDRELEAEHGLYLIAIRFHQHAVEPVPLVFPNCGEHPGDHEYNRYHEHPQIRQIPWKRWKDENGRLVELGMDCWPVPCKNDPPERGCGDGEEAPASGEEQRGNGESRGKGQCCPDDLCCPDCPCGEWVPLALVWYDEKQERWQINTTERRVLGEESQRPLTRISAIHGWTHGGEIGARDPKDVGVLSIQFSRPLAVVPKGETPRRGVNAQTFRAFFVWDAPGKGNSRMIIEPDEPPEYNPEHKLAVFKMRRFLSEYRELKGTVEILLDCDFLLDCDGRAVDGNFIGAKLPSGNGTAGGTFRSWANLPGRENC